MNIFKLFKRKKQEQSPINRSEYTINGRKYLIENTESIKVQCQAEDIITYGWSVEYRCNYNGDWSAWHTRSNKIYNSKHTAIFAHIEMGTRGRYEYRVVPLYKFDNIHFREYKVEQLLGDFSVKKTKYELKSWKLKDDYFFETNQGNKLVKKGTVFIQLEDGAIIGKSNCIDYHSNLNRGILFTHLIPSGIVEEIELKDEKWLYPHLLKCIKNKL